MIHVSYAQCYYQLQCFQVHRHLSIDFDMVTQPEGAVIRMLKEHEKTTYNFVYLLS